jgi:hypothetical protein
MSKLEYNALKWININTIKWIIKPSPYSVNLQYILEEYSLSVFISFLHLPSTYIGFGLLWFGLPILNSALW